MNNVFASFKEQEDLLLTHWLAKLGTAGARLTQVYSADELKRASQRVLHGTLAAMARETDDPLAGSEGKELITALELTSEDFAERGLTPSETATYIFSLKDVMFETMRERHQGEELTEALWRVSTTVDKLGLFTFETFGLARERLIKSQAASLADLATPVIKVWEGILALPLVGAIDSLRSKEIMERLLDAVVANSADIVIIDITGVPVVDTQVASRLMRTVEAVRLLGTRSIVTGINPVVAQTLVQLGVDLGQLVTKASLHAGLAQAFRELKIQVLSEKKA